MALLEAVVFPPAGQHHVPCCVLRGYGVAAPGEFEGVIIKRGVVVQEGDGGEPAPTPPHGGACCPWAGGAATSWPAGPAPSTTLATTSSARRPAAHQQPAVRRTLRRRRGAVVAGAARRRSVAEDESHRQNHIAVERNRRRQMNEHLKVLRSLTPALYIKRGDQASIIGGAIDFIRELQQVLDSLEARKKRRSGGFTTPSPTPSPRSHLGLSSSSAAGATSSAGSSTPSPPVVFGGGAGKQQRAALAVKELAACCNSAVADVEARISGANVLLRTLSRRAPGQAARMVAVLEALHLEVLQLNISTMEDTVLYSFVLKIGLECQLSVEDLAYEVQQTFVCFREQEHEKTDLQLQAENIMYSAMAI